MRARYAWPVYGFDDRGRKEAVATMFDWGASVDLIQHPERFGVEPRMLYGDVPIDWPLPDRRG